MQLSYEDNPNIAYEGKIEANVQYPTTYISRLASETIYFGKLVVAYDAAELELGDQRVRAPAAAADITAATSLVQGVARADITREKINDDWGGYLATDNLGVLRKGRIWVVSEDAVDDLTKGVFVRWQNAGGTPPTEALGSFRATTSADHEQWTEAVKWVAATTIGSVNFGLLELNLP